MRIRITTILLLLLSVVASSCRDADKPAAPAKETPATSAPAEKEAPAAPAAQSASAPETPASGATSPPASDAIDAEHLVRARKLIDGGVAFFLARRERDGGWAMEGGANKPAITAMVLKSLLQHPDYTPSHPVVQKGFESLLSFQQKDGGIYEPQSGVANYTTALAVMALATSQDPRYREAMDKAVAFLKGQQIVPGSESPDGEPITDAHPFAGGVSYGSHGRPDLSNEGMWLDALHEAGVPSDEPAVQRALIFVTRCQNRSESNPMVWAVEGTNDGGFVYAPALKGSLEGESKADADPSGQRLRSYGSMTYVGFKSMLYAGLAKDDPRVKAAYTWIRRYWRLDSNPNMPQAKSKQGLFYYYHVFAKALRAWGEPVIKDLDGKEHNWRHELIDALAERVAPDGSWVNQEAERWNEGSPVLTTAYSVLALQEAMKK